MENPVSVLLIHLGMNVEAGVAELGDLLGKQFHSLGRVTEDDRLVDLQLENKHHNSIIQARNASMKNNGLKKKKFTPQEKNITGF